MGSYRIGASGFSLAHGAAELQADEPRCCCCGTSSRRPRLLPLSGSFQGSLLAHRRPGRRPAAGRRSARGHCTRRDVVPSQPRLGLLHWRSRRRRRPSARSIIHAFAITSAHRSRLLTTSRRAHQTSRPHRRSRSSKRSRTTANSSSHLLQRFFRLPPKSAQSRRSTTRSLAPPNRPRLPAAALTSRCTRRSALMSSSRRARRTAARVRSGRPRTTRIGRRE
jgi:hypothetical protein